LEPDQLDETFGDAALKLKVGELSDIVETAQGYHIIQMLGKKEPIKKSAGR
jgi:parvulin-like peptidyl-prolyl isomerase